MQLGASLKMGYFAQQALDLLDPDLTIEEQLQQDFPHESIGALRNLAGAFQFSGDDIDKKIRALSGGEKTRLVMARMLLDPPNFLVLDEPTNHLDLATKEMLIESLKNFEGTMLFVSHDRAFLRGLSNRVLELGGESGTDAQPTSTRARTSSTSRAPATKPRASTPNRGSKGSNPWNRWNPWNLCIIRLSGGNTFMVKRYLLSYSLIALIGAASVSAQQQKGEVRTAKPISQSDLPAQMRPEAKIVKGYVPPKTRVGRSGHRRRLHQQRRERHPVRAAGAVRRQATGRRHARGARQHRQAAAGADRRAHAGAERIPGRDEPAALVRELPRRQQPRVARDRSDRTARCRPRPRKPAARDAARARARSARGPADSAEDRSLYDRCITRGIPGSMMPAIYGNSYQILQGPGYVAINYEMVHETRMIPLGSAPLGPAPHLNAKIRRYLGDARGHWEGNTLVVETTNFTDKTPYRGSSDNLKLDRALQAARSEHRRVVGDLRRSAYVDEAVDVCDEPDEGAGRAGPFEYACHEGNYGLRNMLTAARAEEAEIKAAAAKGIVKAPSKQDPDEGEK